MIRKAASRPNRYAVLTADIVGSRNIAEFRRRRDQKLTPVSKAHIKEKLVVSPYAVTAWDEFQTIISKPAHAPTVILDLRRYFHPMKLWIGIGIGEVSEPYKRPVNVFSGGAAFERARKAMDFLKGKSNRQRSTFIVSDVELFDAVANTLYYLHDTLIKGISSKQWHTINIRLQTRSQEHAARKLLLDESTVSRSLKRGFYWQIKETKEAMQRLINAYF